MGLEVSRLARNNADWHRLLEICALANTLILDEDGVYDPTNFNDRLLLGLKGTMSEAELHVLKARLRGGILNKVRRGEYRCVFPPASSTTRRQRRPRSRRAGEGDDRALLRDVCPRRLGAPDGQGISGRRPPLSLAPPRPGLGRGLSSAHRVGGDSHPAQSALRGRIRLWAAWILAARSRARRRSGDAL